MLQWISADLRTGSILADLPTLVPEWPLRRTLCKYETATADLYLDGAPPNWEAAVREGATVVACYDEDDDARTIQWAGIVTEQNRDTTKDSIELSLVTAEGYLDRRFVGSATYTATGQNAIAALLIQASVADSDQAPGLPLVVNNLDGVDGTPRDRTYLDSDNATVYARLNELASVDGGIEWTIEWEWSPDGTALVPVFMVGSRIGSSPAPGLAPAALFAMPGAVTAAQQLRSYADGKGANVVTAYSSGQGDTSPTSGPVFGAFDGRPVFEYRYQPSSSIVDAGTLAEYAAKAVAMLAPGCRPLTLTAVLLPETRHGGTWRVGDDLGYAIGGVAFDENGDPYELVRAFPGGIDGTARAVGYEVSEDPQGAPTIAPILAQASIDGSDS